ncbi:MULTISPECIES: hypothetical protein [unclassified Streptomyces]|uniref:hypothetical protein n=1 Tax=unclassified Streptomyces TaxID=2593676 RepID=UPI00342011AB
MGSSMTTDQGIPAGVEQPRASHQRNNTADRLQRSQANKRASTARLCISASVATALAAIFLAWMWGTIAPQPPGLLEKLTHNPAKAAQQAIEEQAQKLSSK